MATIVGIHGIGHQYQGEHSMHARWLPALKDGLLRAGIEDLPPADLACAFYGDIYRPRGGPAPAQLPQGDAAAIPLDPWEAEMLHLWTQAATMREDGPTPQATPGPAPQATPQFVHSALERLTRLPFFDEVAERALIFDLRQVRLYLQDDAIRAAIQARVADAIDAETRVIVAHSLGTVVAYEALCAHPDWPVTDLITLGSPLGIRNLIFDQLRPGPSNGMGAWPASLARWTNIADKDDIVALVRTLATGFGDRVRDLLIDNGAKAHQATSYLTARETGEAIAAGLSSNRSCS